MKIIRLISVVAMLLLFSACSYDTPQIESEKDSIEVQIQEALTAFSINAKENLSVGMELSLEKDRIHSVLKTPEGNEWNQKDNPKPICKGELNAKLRDCIKKEITIYHCAYIRTCGDAIYCVFRCNEF